MVDPCQSGPRLSLWSRGRWRVDMVIRDREEGRGKVAPSKRRGACTCSQGTVTMMCAMRDAHRMSG